MAVIRWDVALNGFEPSGTVDRFTKAVNGLWNDSGIDPIITPYPAAIIASATTGVIRGFESGTIAASTTTGVIKGIDEWRP